MKTLAYFTQYFLTFYVNILLQDLLIEASLKINFVLVLNSLTSV